MCFENALNVVIFKPCSPCCRLATRIPLLLDVDESVGEQSVDMSCLGVMFVISWYTAVLLTVVSHSKSVCGCCSVS